MFCHILPSSLPISSHHTMQYCSFRKCPFANVLYSTQDLLFFPHSLHVSTLSKVIWKKSLYCIFVCGTICTAMNEFLLYYCYLELRNSLNLYLIPLNIPQIHYIWHCLWCMFYNVFFGIENISSESTKVAHYTNSMQTITSLPPEFLI